MSTNEKNRSICALSIFLALVTTGFLAIAVLQFTWTNELERKYEDNLRKLIEMRTKCIQRGLNMASTSTLEDILIKHCRGNANLCVHGPQGDRGLQGPNGTVGWPGVVGQPGDPGDKGLVGPQGDNGTQGDQGPRGPPGTKGPEGFNGTQGLKGPVGDPGQNGTDGNQGDPGEQGEPGVKGFSGDQGPIGPPGKAGVVGPNGEAGFPGEKGDPGAQGPPGQNGTQLDKDCLCIRPFTVTTNPQNTTIYKPIGSALQLACDSNIAKADVSWTLPGLATCSMPTLQGSTLDIVALQPTQEGPYTCTVSTAYGSDSRTFDVHTIGEPLACEFETNDLCSWTINQSSIISWILKTGKTPTGSTGPDYDKTLGEGQQGHYAYIEASLGSKGDLGNLISVELNPSSEICLSFWYNMYGDDIGSLLVKAVDYNANDMCQSSVTTLSRIDGNHGNTWREFNVQIPTTNNPHRIVIQSVHGDGVFGDIAIDDIKSSVGKCKGSV